MTARAMWKAEVRLGEHAVPVRLYAAAQDPKIHFRLLHAADDAPVVQKMVVPRSGAVVDKDSVQKGVEVDRGVFVVISDEDREKLEPRASRTITVEQMVPPTEIDSRWLDRPYYLGPDGDDDRYFALAQGLEERGRVGIAHWVMRKKRYQGALQVKGGYLILSTLRYAEDIIELGEVSPPPERVPGDRELMLAEQLVSTLEEPFDPDRYRDETAVALRELLEAKAAGKTVKKAAPKDRRTEGSLEDALRKSLSARKDKRRAG